MNDVEPTHRTHAQTHAPARAAPLAAAAIGVMLGGCAALAPGGLPPGTPIAQARQSLVGPTGEYGLPGGGTRLEFAQGSFGRRTYMLDFDAGGRLTTTQQVLTEANLSSVQPGTPIDEVRMRYGRPVWVYGVRFPVPSKVWSYRFDGGDCVWYQISIGDESQRVTESSLGPDPACNGPNERE
jgi:hypothetical protein